MCIYIHIYEYIWVADPPYFARAVRMTHSPAAVASAMSVSKACTQRVFM